MTPRVALVLMIAIMTAACRDVQAPLPHLTQVGPPARIAASPDVVFGPERFVRGGGQPQEIVRAIATHQFDGPFTLVVRNGAPDGAQRVTSARVAFDGVEIFSPSDFREHDGKLSTSLRPAALAELRVTIAGAPGSFLEILVLGHRRGAVVCPDGTGDYLTLAAAVASVPDVTDILLCDGTHRASDVALGDKSLAIAALGPGTPTLDAAGAWASLRVNVPNAAGVALTVRGLRFIGSTRHAILVVNQHGDVEISENVFVGGTEGVQVGSSSGAIVRGNDFDGQSTAIRVLQSTNVRVESNDFTNCGVDYCVAFFDSPGAQVVGNRLTISYARPTDNPITISAWPSGGDAVITDNEVVGVGSGGSGSRFDPMTYPIHVSGIQVAAASATISRNRVTNARGGINVTPVISATGTDNVFTHVFAPFLAGGSPMTSTVSFTRNDITDYMMPVEWDGYASADLTCNWWGSVGPPTGGAPSTAQLSPWATTPIAGNASASCP